MNPDSKSTPRRKGRRASRSVYIYDWIANGTIRVGGIMVVVAVLGLVAFIFSQVIPLFSSSQHGAMAAKSEAMVGNTLYIGYDEYRRVGVRIGDNNQAMIFSVLSGETLESRPLADFVPEIDAQEELRGLLAQGVSSASVTLRPFTQGFYGEYANVPRFGVAIGTRGGGVVAGTLAYITEFRRYELGKVPEELQDLRRPEDSEFKSPDYLPQVRVVKDNGRTWVVEHLTDFGFFRYLSADLELNRSVPLPSDGQAIESLHIAIQHAEPERDKETITGAITADGRALVRLELLEVNAMTEQIEPREIWTGDVTAQIEGRPVMLQVHELRANAVFATRDGLVHMFQRQGDDDAFKLAYPGVNVLGFNEQEREEWSVTAAASRDDDVRPEGPIRLTAMSYLLGDTTLLLGDSYGGVQSWFPVRATPEDPNPRLQRIRWHDSGSGAIAGFSSAQQTKAFAVWDQSGRVRCIHNMSERVFFDETIEGAAPVAGYFASKADGLLVVDDRQQVQKWWLEPKHVEISFRSLFGEVFYEGYQAPRYEWQSHAGTDDVETKYSMIPLIRGSLKGGMYALLFALPLAVLGAIYTSEFMAPRLRNVIKPSMEVMASLPSVVLGFLGALYFAPEAARNMPALMVFALLTPALFMLFGWIFGQLPPYVTKRAGPLVTTAMLALILVTGWILAGVIGPRLETHVFPATEGANPALIDSQTFQPLTEEAALAMSAGDFRSWTDGGRELPRPLVAANGVELPKGWWIPGGHNLLATLLILPFAVLAGAGLKFGHAMLFGGTVWSWTFRGRGRASPIARLRDAIAGTRAGMRPVIADASMALAMAAICLLLGIVISNLVSPVIESLLFSYQHPTAGTVADFRRWMTGPEGWKYNQTNSLVVGFAMGFAVIPLIYSISEDALSSVPNQLRAASLACGASRWQTALRVVIPAAASGIFSAIVIGLGRALGETMIVVMAAGGTPLMEMQPLSGFRSLSAAIATEMPEAPHGSTHYRTLFLGGLMLFAMTFVISTLAELVRMRLRKKLSRM